MRLSTTDIYAFHALGYLATQPSQRWASSDTISRATGIARPYLLQVLAALVNAEVVASKKGTGGGYALTRPPQQIDLQTVVRAIDGPIAPLSCVSLNWYHPCPEEPRCHARTTVYQRLRDAMLATLADMTVADLARDTAAGVDYRHCAEHLLTPR